MERNESWGKSALAWYVKLSPWIASYLLVLFVFFYIGVLFVDAEKFLTSGATTGWAAAISSGGAAIVALAVALISQRQSEKERAEDREHDDKQRHDDRTFAEEQRAKALTEIREEQERTKQENERRQKDARGIELSAFAGTAIIANSAISGMVDILARPERASSESHDGLRARCNSTIKGLSQVPLKTAFEYEPRLGAHLSYVLDYLMVIELSSREWTPYHIGIVKDYVDSVARNIEVVQTLLMDIRAAYRDAHLTAHDR
ncbi:hypothetical protein ACOTEG_31250 [Achromobacter xylosoxidans]|uniref:hypothetical protein n=1 Tax=Alcaligenes xylosoxydans xylosoxydans TaxID=85698 RepID=UPI001041B53F|nr:hypothetical protein [Achromobacter xylosoxidans]